VSENTTETNKENTEETNNTPNEKKENTAAESTPVAPATEKTTEAKEEVQEEIRESFNESSNQEQTEVKDEVTEENTDTKSAAKNEDVNPAQKEDKKEVKEVKKEIQGEIRDSFNDKQAEVTEETQEETEEEIEAPKPEVIYYNGNTVIAIDGPSGTGKSTTAKLLAKKLNYLYIDSGAMYRAVTYSVIQNKIPPTEKEQIIALAKTLDIILQGEEVLLNGTDIAAPIRNVDVTANVSTISAIKEVREMLVAKQREFAETNNVVMDGRDIGTVVFPNAKYKFYLVCDLKTRAARRQQDFRDIGLELAKDRIVKELQKRDDIDTKREESPLKKADDAVIVDTTNMIIEEQVEHIHRIIVPRV